MFHNYIEALDTFNTNSGSREVLVLDLFTEILEDFVKALLDHVALDTTMELTQHQACPANNGDKPPLIPWPNDERDRYILCRKREGAYFKTIAAEVNARTEWEGIESIEGLMAALKRYCKRTGEAYPHAPGRGTNKRESIERD